MNSSTSTITDTSPSMRSPTDVDNDEAPLTNPPSDNKNLTFTVDDALDSQGLGRFQLLLALLSGLCWTAESMEMLLLSFIKAPLQCQWSISDPQAALITTSVGIGMLSGATFWGLFSDARGRRTGFIFCNLVAFLAGLASAIAPNYALLLIARGIVGFGIGGVPVAFSLLMEYLPSQYRGKFGLALALFWSLGAIFEAGVAMAVLPKLGWRALIAISTIPLGTVLLSVFVVPESPRWLLTKGRTDDAMWALGRVSKVNGVPLPVGELSTHVPEVGGMVAKVRRFGQFGELLRRGVRTLVAKIWILWFVAAFLYYGLVMLQPEVISKENLGQRCEYAKMECAALSSGGNSTCAKNSICLWAKEDCVPKGGLEETGEENTACARQLSTGDFLSTLWASVGELPGVVAAFLVVEAIGRRPLIGYMFGLTGAAFVALLPCLGRNAETVAFFFARGASSGAFQAVYLFTNELYPSAIRTSAMGISSSVSRVGLIVTPFVAQYLENFNHAATVWVYFAASALAVIAVILIPIETTQRPLMGSMDELVVVIREGETKDEPSFAKDPSANAFARFLRWPARIDGGALT